MFTTAADMQTSVTMHVFQVDCPMALNKVIGAEYQGKQLKFK